MTTEVKTKPRVARHPFSDFKEKKRDRLEVELKKEKRRDSNIKEEERGKSNYKKNYSTLAEERGIAPTLVEKESRLVANRPTNKNLANYSQSCFR